MNALTLPTALLLTAIFLFDYAIINLRIKSQINGNAFVGLSKAMQLAYVSRFAIFAYNGIIGYTLDTELNNVESLVAIAVSANALFIIIELTPSSKKTKPNGQIQTQSTLSFRDRALLNCAQLMFQAAWLSPLVINAYADKFKGTAIAIGSLINGINGAIIAFKLEPLLAKNASNTAALESLSNELSRIRIHTAALSGLMGASVWLMSLI